MRAVFRQSLFVAAVLGVVFAFWLGSVKRWHASVAPGGDTLVACLAKVGDPWMAEVFAHGEQEYLMLWGHSQAFPRFPSGPPVYIFDRKGVLVDWVADSGDIASWWERWPPAAQRRKIDRDEMMRWLNAAR